MYNKKISVTNDKNKFYNPIFMPSPYEGTTPLIRNQTDTYLCQQR